MAPRKDAAEADAVALMADVHHEHESPLAALTEVFEESGDGNRFVGDTMFWKYFEFIKVDHVRNPDTCECRTLRLMFYETIFYVVLLVMVTALAYSLQSSNRYLTRSEQIDYWSGCDAEGFCKIDSVEGVNSFWTWMKNDFIPKAYPTYSHPKRVANLTTSFPNNEFSIIFSPSSIGTTQSNVLLGAIRMRQIRVQKNQGCMVSRLFRHAFNVCYGAFSETAKSTDEFSQRFTPVYLLDAFKWSSAAQTRQTSTLGKWATYGGDGFMLDLPIDRNSAEVVVQDLYDWHWVDRATRAVVVEFTTLSANVNIVVSNKLVFEFGSSGVVGVRQYAEAARVVLLSLSTNTGSSLLLLLLQLVVLLLFEAYTVWVFWLVYRTFVNFLGKKGFMLWVSTTPKRRVISQFLRSFVYHFQFGWNIIDLVQIVLFNTYVWYRWDACSLVWNLPELANEMMGHPQVFMPFATVVQQVTTSDYVFAVIAMLCWAKLFKYLCLVSYCRLLVRVVENCAKELLMFSFLLVLMFCGFSVAFYIGFCDTDDRFSSLYAAFVMLFFMLLGGVRASGSWFVAGSTLLKPVIFCIYCVIIYYVFLNIFMAIVLSAYSISREMLDKRTKGDDEKAEKENPMLVFVQSMYFSMKGSSRVEDGREAFLSPEETHIRLDELPGVVARKWIERKRKLQQLANKSLAGLEIFEEGPPGCRALALPGSTNHGLDTDGQLAMYEIPFSMLGLELTMQQLQRLLDEDETLPILLGTSDALKVIRDFRQPQDKEDADTPTLNPKAAKTPSVGRLQESLYGRIEEFEKQGVTWDTPDVPEIKALADQLHDGLGEVTNQLRGELLGTVEGVATLAERLTELTHLVKAVRDNHEAVLRASAEDNESEVEFD